MSDKDRVYAAERILKKRKNREGKLEYYVKWKDWSLKHSTWEPEQNILDIRLIESFEAVSGSSKRGPKKKETPKSTKQTSKNESCSKNRTPSKPPERKMLSSTRRNRRVLEKEEISESKKYSNLANASNLNTADENSCSSEEQSFSKIDNSGRKRKAEILSKESGKIGVTITTSDEAKVPKNTQPCRVENNLETKQIKEEIIKSEKDIPAKQIIKRIFTSPGPEFWMRRNPVANQIFITDVTVNTETITIRECKSEKGFFRSRDLCEPEVLAEKLDDVIKKEAIAF